MTAFQNEFTSALLDPKKATPNGIIDPDGRVAGKRFDVYRNNVVHSLIEAMGDAFPAIKKIVGDPFFDAMAAVYVRAHPPKTPMMMFYGQDFPAFLQTFEPAAHLPYLADVAALELARRYSYHAADADPVDAMVLTTLAPEALMDACFTFVPSAVLFQVNNPAQSIWQFNMVEPFQITATQEWVLITRPEMDVVANNLDAATYAFLVAIQGGSTLAVSADAGLTIDPKFDLSAAIGLMMGTQIIHQVKS
jgi:hypothetical protein